MPLKEFRCAAHGPFEALVKTDVVVVDCPKGCSKRFVKQEIRTAPSYHVGKTGKLDAIQKDLATSMGLPDLKVDKDDNRSLMDRLRSKSKEDLQNAPSEWAAVPGALAPGWSQRKEKPVAVDPRLTFGMKGGNTLAAQKLPQKLPTQIMASAKAEDIK